MNTGIYATCVFIKPIINCYLHVKVEDAQAGIFLFSC